MLGILRAGHPHWIARDRIESSASSRSRRTARDHRRNRPRSGAGRASGVRCRSRSPNWGRATTCRCGRCIGKDRGRTASAFGRPIRTARRRRGRIVPASHDADTDRHIGALDLVPTPDPTVRAASRVVPAHAGDVTVGPYTTGSRLARGRPNASVVRRAAVNRKAAGGEI